MCNYGIKINGGYDTSETGEIGKPQLLGNVPEQKHEELTKMMKIRTHCSKK